MQACTPAGLDLAVLMIEDGRAVLLLIGQSVTLKKAKIEMNMPRKTGAASAGVAKATEKFMNACTQAVKRHIDWNIGASTATATKLDNSTGEARPRSSNSPPPHLPISPHPIPHHTGCAVKALVVSGPGFTRDRFISHLAAECVRENDRPWVEHRNRIVSVHASSSYASSLKEVMADPGVAALIQDTKAVRESKALEDFYAMMARDSARAFYGPGHVQAAAEMGAVQTLLICDQVLRVYDVARRRRYAEMIADVRSAGGEVLVFSSAHVSGEQLAKLTGVAAILRFPLPDLEDMEIDAF